MRVLIHTVVIFVLAFAGAGFAQDTKPDYRGIGLLARSIWGGCTGTLVERDLVLTAAHCLVGKHDNGENFSPKEYLFYPANANRIPGPGYRGKSVAVHPVYILLKNPDPKRLRRDIGLIRLEEAVPAQLANPLAISEPDVFPDRGFLIPYHGVRDARQRQRACRVISEEDQFLVVGCRVVGGESDAPLLIRQNGKLVIYAVISSRFKIKSQPVGLASVAGHGDAGILAAMPGG